MRFSQLRTIISALFFLGGASALIYEITWVRLLSLAFGVSVYAVSAVLVAYMGGLALGSWLFGRIAARQAAAAASAPLRLYALISAGIGICALLSPLVVTLLTTLYVAIANQFQPGFYAFNLVRFGLAALMLLVPTTLMGGTLPVLGQLLARREESQGGELGALYAANTAGGVIGTALAGLILIRFLGVTATIIVAAAIDFVIAGIALALSYQPLILPQARVPQQPRKKPRKESAKESQRKRIQVEQTPAPAGPMPITEQQTRLVLVGFACSGFAALGYQVVWTRLLAIFSLNAIFSFTVMLTTFLVGLALGGWLATRRVDRVAQPLTLFGSLQLAIGVSGVVVLFIFARLPTLLEWFNVTDTYGKLVASEFFAAIITMFVPTVLMGATFPVAARIYGKPTTPDQNESVPPERSAVGERVGRLYALNTLGAMLGSCITGFVLIPLLGLQHAALVLAAVNLMLGAVALLMIRPVPKLRLGGALALAIGSVLLLPPGIYLGFREGTTPLMMFYREGVDATVSVFQVTNPPLKISFVNGRSEVPTDKFSMQAFYLLGHLPPLLRPQAREALMVSFGNGIATGAMSRHGLSHIQAVELVAEQIEAARLYSQENHNVLNYPGLSIANEDGRNYLLRSDRHFDIITADATHPINTSSWALFTREFYTLVRGRLANDGVFVQWLPFHDLSRQDYRDIIKTFQSVFPHTTLWFTGGSHSFLVATPQPLTREQVAALAPQLNSPAVGGDLGDARTFESDFLMDEAAVATYVADAKIVTDDRAFFLPAKDMDAIIQDFTPFMQAARASR